MSLFQIKACLNMEMNQAICFQLSGMKYRMPHLQGIARKLHFTCLTFPFCTGGVCYQMRHVRHTEGLVPAHAKGNPPHRRLGERQEGTDSGEPLANERRSLPSHVGSTWHSLPPFWCSGQRGSEDPDEHDHAAEEDLQPPVHVPAYRGQLRLCAN